MIPEWMLSDYNEPSTIKQQPFVEGLLSVCGMLYIINQQTLKNHLHIMENAYRNIANWA